MKTVTIAESADGTEWVITIDTTALIEKYHKGEFDE